MVHTCRMGLNAEYAGRIRDLAARSGEMSDQEFLSRVLTATAVWRSKIWANTLVNLDTHIRTGPFKGMNYVVQSAEGALMPRMLGIYERELHGELAALAESPPETVIDIGCAEGYYAVGLARLMPGVTVHAFDIDETARRRCGLLAEANGVADRVKVGGEFTGADFARFAGTRTLVFIDAEGFEDEILRPDLYPALRGFDLIVETHPIPRPGVTGRLIERFASTHDITRIDPAVTRADLIPRVAQASHLDMMIACWEWRAGPTPWLVMRSRTPPD